ncbi:MAG: hypothetical protein VCB07_05890 [Gammaproteobacteria bacterium]
MDQLLVMVKIKLELAKLYVMLGMQEQNVTCTATTHSLPFYDLKNRKRTAM